MVFLTAVPSFFFPIVVLSVMVVERARLTTLPALTMKSCCCSSPYPSCSYWAKAETEAAAAAAEELDEIDFVVLVSKVRTRKKQREIKV